MKKSLTVVFVPENPVVGEIRRRVSKLTQEI